MALIFRWLLRLFAGLVLAGVAGVVVLYWFATRSIPDYNARFEARGLTGPVEIIRDNSNVPHVFGQTDADSYYGLGFVHAQDRLWQMMMMRRTVQGRLSELFGTRTVPTDELMRRLDLYSAAQASVSVQDDYARAALSAYAAGVNGWLEQVNSGALGRGAPEYWLFAPQIAPWTPADSIAIGKLMALQLSPHMRAEVLRARVSLAVPPERLPDLLPDAPGSGVAALPDYASLVPGLLPGPGPRSVIEARLDDPLMPQKPWGFAGASNAWAAAPSRSAAGGTILANDPHLDLAAPAIWYLARIELASGGVIGGTIPGMPTVLVGRTARLGWGLTASYLDDADVHIERLNPDAPDQVLTPQGYIPLTSRPSIVQVADELPLTFTLRFGPNGPILPARHAGLSEITPAGHVASLAWTALARDDTTISGALALMRAGDVGEAIAAGEAIVAPSMNLMLVDREAIAMQVVGRMPRRSAAHQSQGRMPSPGWRPENIWQGYAAYAALPRFLDPQGGILGNTNNKIIDRPFPFHVSFLWGDTQRIQRWQRLMQNREVHTRDSFIEAQLDTVSVSARTLLPLIGAELWFTGEAAADGTPERLRQRALGLLAAWNGEMNEHMPEPLLYAAWLRALGDRLMRDDLGPLADEFAHVDPLFVERVFRDVDGASAWCDIRQSAPVESCPEIARLALDDALLWIGERYGTALESLRWGDAHEAVHDHPVLRDAPVLRWFVNIRQSTSGGDNTLMRGLTSGRGPDPFQNVHGPAYRGVYDFSDPDSSVFIISTGQSGHPLSRHYDDLGELWRRGEYIPMSLDPELARAAAVGVTMLVPRP